MSKVLTVFNGTVLYTLLHAVNIKTTRAILLKIWNQTVLTMGLNIKYKTTYEKVHNVAVNMKTTGAILLKIWNRTVQTMGLNVKYKTSHEKSEHAPLM